MGKEVATTNADGQSLMVDMAGRYGLDAEAFRHTMMKTVMPAGAGAEELAAFLIVAKEYSLNPVLREIHAFPKKGGGVQPIVSIDGWVNLLNSHKAFDGYEFQTDYDDDGKLYGVTCTIHRNDRSRPTIIQELYSECKMNTDPWKNMPTRMLRHKALKECARYAFGFAGIMDEDDYAKADFAIESHVPLTAVPSGAPPPPESAKPKPEPEDIIDVEPESADKKGQTGGTESQKADPDADSGGTETQNADSETGSEDIATGKGDSEPEKPKSAPPPPGGDPLEDGIPDSLKVENRGKNSGDAAPDPEDGGDPLELFGDPSKPGFDFEGYEEWIRTTMKSLVDPEDIDEVRDEVRGFLDPHAPEVIVQKFDDMWQAQVARAKEDIEKAD